MCNKNKAIGLAVICLAGGVLFAIFLPSAVLAVILAAIIVLIGLCLLK